MLLQEEKHTAQAISFAVNLNNQGKSHTEDPEVKKRLEAANSHQNLTLDQINEKLKKAEEKRLSCRRTADINDRRSRVNERKAEFENGLVQKLVAKAERDHSNAEQKRSENIVHVVRRVRNHNMKVNEVHARKSSQEKKALESKKEKLEKRLNLAQQKREQFLEQVKSVAIASAKKKHSDNHIANVDAAPSVHTA